MRKKKPGGAEKNRETIRSSRKERCGTSEEVSLVGGAAKVPPERDS